MEKELSINKTIKKFLFLFIAQLVLLVSPLSYVFAQNANTSTSKVVASQPVVAPTSSSTTTLNLATTSTQKLLSDVEKYINSLQKISGNFKQNSSNGARDAGKFYISKPGKMRLEYESPILLVADGNSIVYQDKKLDQISYISMNSNPASIVLNNDIRLTGANPSIKVKSITQTNNITEITLSTPTEKKSGTITLLFETKPLSLTGWRVRDAQGITTTIQLSNIKPETTFNSNLFKISRNKTIGTSTKSKSKYY